jgi:hypothetical protein
MTIYDTEQMLFAENMALGQRLQRLSLVLAGMARDLAASRREAALLRRENDRLRACSAAVSEETSPASRGTAPRAGVPSQRPQTPNALLCDGCGNPVEQGERADADAAVGVE